MAIQPVYAQAILTGTKRIEFRKRPLAPDVQVVLIYETAPSQAIVGFFTVAEVIVDTPRRLWRRYGVIGGIAKGDFDAYYAESKLGAGLLVDRPRRLLRSVPLALLDPIPGIPQSYSYLSGDMLDQLGREAKADDFVQLLGDLVSRVTAPARELASAARALVRS